jgi:hypothetical protein
MLGKRVSFSEGMGRSTMQRPTVVKKRTNSVINVTNIIPRLPLSKRNSQIFNKNYSSSDHLKLSPERKKTKTKTETLQDLIKVRNSLKEDIVKTRDLQTLEMINKRLYKLNSQINRYLNLKVQPVTIEEGTGKVKVTLLENGVFNAKIGKEFLGQFSSLDSDRQLIEEEKKMIIDQSKLPHMSQKLELDLRNLITSPPTSCFGKTTRNDKNIKFSLISPSAQSNFIPISHRATNPEPFSILRSRNYSASVERRAKTLKSDNIISNFQLNSQKDLDSMLKFKKFNEKLAKVARLKGELELIEQKKKYDLNKKVKIVKEHSNTAFMRSSKDPYQYLPSRKLVSNLSEKCHKISGFKSLSYVNVEDFQSKQDHQCSIENRNANNILNPSSSKITKHRRNSSLISEASTFHKTNFSTYMTGLAKNERPVRVFSPTTISSSILTPHIAQTNRTTNPELMMQRVKKIVSDVFHENRRAEKIADKMINDHKLDLSHESAKEDKVNLEELYKRFDLHNIDTMKNYDHHSVEIRHKMLLEKCKDPRAKIYLRKAYSQIELEDKLCNHRNEGKYANSENKLDIKKMHKTFKKIALETINLKRKIQIENPLDNRQKNMDKDIKNINETDMNTFKTLNWMVMKKNIMKHIKPLIFVRRFKKRIKNK